MDRSSMWDVIVIGQGSAGAAAALHAARLGLRVLGLDARPLSEAGARWVNSVPPWCFDAAGVDRPNEPELVGRPRKMHLVVGSHRVEAGGYVRLSTTYHLKTPNSHLRQA